MTFVNHEVRRATSTDMAPHFLLMQPVFSELEAELSKIVGLVHATISWDLYLANLLPDGLSTLYCVVRNTCGGVFTYVLHGKSVSSPCKIYSVAKLVTVGSQSVFLTGQLSRFRRLERGEVRREKGAHSYQRLDCVWSMCVSL